METAGITMLEGNSSEVKFMSDEVIVKLINSTLSDDQYLGFIYTFKKYPKLIKYVARVPEDKIQDDNTHNIQYRDIMNNSPLYGIKKNHTGVNFNWEKVFDYLWT